MNKDAWENLSEADKKAFERAAENSYSKLGDVMKQSFSRQVEILQADGAEIRTLSDEEISFWEAATNYEEAQKKYYGENSPLPNAVKSYMKNFLRSSDDE